MIMTTNIFFWKVATTYFCISSALIYITLPSSGYGEKISLT